MEKKIKYTKWRKNIKSLTVVLRVHKATNPKPLEKKKKNVKCFIILIDLLLGNLNLIKYNKRRKKTNIPT